MSFIALGLNRTSYFIDSLPLKERAAPGDHDTVFEDEVDVVADSFRASIIFRLPAPMFMYHGLALEVNPFCLSGNGWNRGEIREHNTNFTYQSYPPFPDSPWTDPEPSERPPSIGRRFE